MKKSVGLLIVLIICMSMALCVIPNMVNANEVFHATPEMLQGKSYAVFTEAGELIFFRSNSTYEHQSTGTFTDIMGNTYEGVVYCGDHPIDDGMHNDGFEKLSGTSYYPFPSDMSKNVLSVRVAEGQAIRPWRHFFGNYYNGNMCNMFYRFSNCTSIDLTGFDTEHVTHWNQCFYGCNSLVNLNINGIDFTEATVISSMFNDCSSLTSLDLQDYTFSNVQYAEGLFARCSSLTNISFSSDISFASNQHFDNMFSYCSSLEHLDLSSFNTSSAITMKSMFGDCRKLEELDLSNFNTTNVTTMEYMFENCSKLVSLNVSSFDTSNVTSMQNMFSFCESLQNLNIRNFRVPKVKNVSKMFCGCASLTELDLSEFNTSTQLKNASYMFGEATVGGLNEEVRRIECGIKYLDISGMTLTGLSEGTFSMWDTYNPTKLESIVMGERTTPKATYMVLPTPPSSKDGMNYTGKWIRDDKSYGPYTPNELIDYYDGNTMAGTWVWEKASYTVSYSYTGTIPNGASELPQDTKYEQESTVIVAEDATAPGYRFNGWSRTGTFTMPAENVEITGSFTANTNTPYKIEHYTKDMNANTYTLKETENKTGTTDTTITANPKNYDGFTFDNTITGTVQSGNIDGNGSLVLKLYYTRNYYNVSYSYTDHVTGESELPGSATYEYGASVTVATNATAPGYTFSGWSRTGTFTMPADNVVITGSWTPKTNTVYKVEHYKQNIDNNQFTLAETENLTGTTDTTATATPKTYEGFTFDNTITGTVQSGNIAGNGSLVLRLYYTRNSYNVTYSYTSAPVSASLLPADSTYKYGATVTVAADSTAAGYTFSGWSRTGTFTMPAENVEITGGFTANTNTAYKIEHYKQNIDNNQFTLAETENKTGTTDTTANATPKTYSGFTFDNTISGTNQSDYIVGNGSLVLKLYYTRNSYSVTYSYTSAPVSASLLPADSTYKYEAPVTVAGEATAPGYTFSGWSRTGTFTMPAENVEITGGFTANTNTAYKIEHYKQNLNNNQFTLAETENKTGVTDNFATATPKVYTGFTYDSEASQSSGLITGDGNLVLKLYYSRNTYTVSYQYQGNIPSGASTLPASASYKYEAPVTVAEDATAAGYTFSGWSRTGTFTMPAENVEITGGFIANTDTAYRIEHYKQNLNNNQFTLAETENKTGTTDNTATASPNIYSGFTFDNTITGTLQSGTITGDGNLVLRLYYSRNTYTVSYQYQGNIPTGASALPSSASYKYEATVTVAGEATAPGYTFSGWNRTGAFTMPAEDVIIKGSFSSNSDTGYKVEHYLEDLNANTYSLKETDQLYGETDTEITATPNTYTGFTFDNTVSGTKQTGIISGNDSLVLKLYYTRNSYNVSYSYTSAPTTASQLPTGGIYEYGATVTVAEDATAAGYTFSGWSRTGTFEMPAEDVEITGGFTANTNTTYKVEHYIENLNEDTYTLKETENKTGTTDTLANATPKTYTGFTFNSGASTISGNIDGNGSLVLELYYTRNSYNVSYSYTSAPSTASALPTDSTYEYEATVTVAEEATALGYTFSGWNRTGIFEMPAEDIEITGGFTANTNTSYKIEHYQKALNSNTYTLKETENKTGTTDTLANATPKTYTGFTFNSGASTISGNIAGNGSLVLKLYYTRNSYNVSYSYTSAPTTASQLPTGGIYEYGATVTVANDATATGYTFSGWSRTGTFEMPAEDVEITGGFTANTDTPYKIEHYIEKDHTGEYILKDEENLSGETDTEVTAQPNEYDGFKLDESIEGTKRTGIIAGDGSLVLKLYYKNDTYKYKIEYFFDGERDDTLEEIFDAEIDSEVFATPVTPVRHKEKSYTLVSKEHKVIISINNEENIIKVYYETDVLDYAIDGDEETNEGDGIPDKYQIKIKYKVENGSWNDGTSKQKTEVITLLDNDGNNSEEGTGNIRIPEVGSKPNEGYTEGSWDKSIPEKVSKTDDGREFVYKYKEIEPTEDKDNGEIKPDNGKTDIVPTEGKSSNPKTGDKVQRYFTYGLIGLIILLIAKRIRRKYSRKARKIQY